MSLLTSVTVSAAIMRTINDGAISFLIQTEGYDEAISEEGLCTNVNRDSLPHSIFIAERHVHMHLEAQVVQALLEVKSPGRLMSDRVK